MSCKKSKKQMLIHKPSSSSKVEKLLHGDDFGAQQMSICLASTKYIIQISVLLIQSSGLFSNILHNHMT